mmetsp:Transcript_17847/g.33086  ORF Transcript_17847/g.33086 Transcript_17847/m.33086 type:complete len:82 (+) Transcript_17847:229-474(+)
MRRLLPNQSDHRHAEAATDDGGGGEDDVQYGDDVADDDVIASPLDDEGHEAYDDDGELPMPWPSPMTLSIDSASTSSYTTR